MGKKSSKSQSAKPVDKCLPSIKNLGKYGFLNPTDANVDLSFWLEHSRNTCWNTTNADFIRSKVGGIRYNNKELSHTWVEASSKMFCSLWDGGIGIAALTGLCPSEWDVWYSACKKDYFSGDSRGSELGAGDIAFCSHNSLICSKLEDIYSDSKDFWTQMGIDVNVEDQSWYDGVPWEKKEGRAKPSKKTYERKRKAKSRRKEKSIIDSALDGGQEFYEHHPYIFVTLYSAVLFFFTSMSISFLLKVYNPFRTTDTYMDEKLKEKRIKILEKRAQKSES